VDVGEGGNRADPAPYSDSAPDVALHKWLVRGLVHTSDYISAAI
jgi:hypothetical protein